MDQETCASIIDLLRSPDVPQRLDAFSKLKLVAAFVGPETTRTQLIPYLQEFSDDDDCILIEICNQLQAMLELIGGIEHCHVLLDLLESFCLSEDAAVRNRSVDVIMYIISRMPRELVLRYILPLIRHLVTSDWHSGRISVAGLLPLTYPLVPPHLQNEICAIFGALCIDEHPSVRRAACMQFGVFCCVAHLHPPTTMMLYHLLAHTARDEHDSIRLHTVDACIIVADVLKMYGQEHRVMSLIFTLCLDRSWRIRYLVAIRFPLLLAAIGIDSFTGGESAEYFAKLLNDSENEVKAAAAGVVGRVCRLLGPEKARQHIFPLLTPLASDSYDLTRINFARDVLWVCQDLTQSEMRNILIPLFEALLRDQKPEVQLNLILRLADITPFFSNPATLLQSISPSVIRLLTHRQWRIRLAMTKQLLILSEQLPSDCFSDNIIDLAMAQISDKVASVRDAAVANFAKFCVIKGSAWVRDHLLNYLTQMVVDVSQLPCYASISESLSQGKPPYDSTPLPHVDLIVIPPGTKSNRPYQCRLSAANAILRLNEVFDLELAARYIYPLLEILLHDPVFNVQFIAIRAAGALLARIHTFTPVRYNWISDRDDTVNPTTVTAVQPNTTHLQPLLSIPPNNDEFYVDPKTKGELHLLHIIKTLNIEHDRIKASSSTKSPKDDPDSTTTTKPSTQQQQQQQQQPQHNSAPEGPASTTSNKPQEGSPSSLATGKSKLELLSLLFETEGIEEFTLKAFKKRVDELKKEDPEKTPLPAIQELGQKLIQHFKATYEANKNTVNELLYYSKKTLVAIGEMSPHEGPDVDYV